MQHLLIAILLSLASIAAHSETPKISMGNGEHNWIHLDGATRDGATFVIPEVNIAGAGWLVMHPFKDGKPNGKVVAGYAPLAAGTTMDASISVEPAAASGDYYIVMLHSDANSNAEFDFVFVNEREVVDAAVFEGTTMIGHIYKAP